MSEPAVLPSGFPNLRTFTTQLLSNDSVGYKGYRSAPQYQREYKTGEGDWVSSGWRLGPRLASGKVYIVYIYPREEGYPSTSYRFRIRHPANLFHNNTLKIVCGISKGEEDGNVPTSTGTYPGMLFSATASKLYEEFKPDIDPNDPDNWPDPSTLEMENPNVISSSGSYADWPASLIAKAGKDWENLSMIPEGVGLSAKTTGFCKLLNAAKKVPSNAILSVKYPSNPNNSKLNITIKPIFDPLSPDIGILDIDVDKKVSIKQTPGIGNINPQIYAEYDGKEIKIGEVLVSLGEIPETSDYEDNDAIRKVGIAYPGNQYLDFNGYGGVSLYRSDIVYSYAYPSGTDRTVKWKVPSPDGSIDDFTKYFIDNWPVSPYFDIDENEAIVWVIATLTPK